MWLRPVSSHSCPSAQVESLQGKGKCCEALKGLTVCEQGRGGLQGVGELLTLLRISVQLEPPGVASLTLFLLL